MRGPSGMRAYGGGQSKWAFAPRGTDYTQLLGRPIPVNAANSALEGVRTEDQQGGLTVFFYYVVQNAAKLGSSGGWLVTAVRSSVIHSILYNRRSNQLAVMMRSGVTYKYSGIAKDVHRLFLKAASKGAFYNSYIKGKYPSITVK